MNHNSTRFLTGIFLLILFSNFSLISQSISVDAGADQFLNWENNNSTKLKGKVSPIDVNVEWTCPMNPDVHFDNAGIPETEVTFPRPGYYLLKFTAFESEDKKICDNVIINVFKPNSYKNRISDLITLMTLDEKISQLANLADSIPRLRILAYNYWSEALHGILGRGATSFPQAVALGSTWDPDLVYRVATAISDEARVKNKIEGKGLTYWSPTVNIARDPRWGRNEESYSEDPYLLSQMGVAFVKGMQGDHPYYLKTVSTPKHFIANNEESRRHTGSSDVDMRSLWEYYMPAFEKTIVEGKAYSIMSAYNELNHVPSSANTYLLTDILRRKWGFEGYVVSDCGAINDIVNGHHFLDSDAEAVARSLIAGCDLNCGQYYPLYLLEALELGLLEEKDIDNALRRVLSARFRLGEFDPPEIVPYGSIGEEKLDSKENRALALEAAHKAMVLLKNDNILPLDKNKINSIAVIGPNAEELQLGIYSGWPNVNVGPLEGIKAKADSLGIKVNYLKGSDIGGGLLRLIDSKYFTEVEGTGKTGMKGEYFDNMSLSGEPVVTRIDSIVNFSFGLNPPAPGIPGDKFSVRWTGKIVPPEMITCIGTRTDDGARLYLNDELLFEDWIEHGEKPNSANVKLDAGKEYKIVFEHFDNRLGASARLMWDLGLKDFGGAKELAAQNDLVILVLGTSPEISEEELDRTEIELPKLQQELVKEIAEVNKNIVLVLINGGPVALGETEKHAKAIVEAWYAGQSSGTAIADVLFGDVNPGGKLPETFYASTEQLPPFADYDLINNERTYLYFDKPVLYPFGYGLSYTSFEYSGLKLSDEKISEDDEIEIYCSVKNTGKYKGDEVIQVYVKDVEASVKVPIRQLKRFKRVTLEPNKTKEVGFTLPASELSFYDIESNSFIIEPGKFEIQIGSSSNDIRLKDVFVVE
ncbi:MAG: glycoside hydrolase family 3 C-terminal domain-containing protein [Ignavibacteria bacterium]